MPNPGITRAVAREAVAAVNKCLDEGFPYKGHPSARHEAARRLGINEVTIFGRLRAAKHRFGIEPKQAPSKPAPSPEFSVKHRPAEAFINGPAFELVSRKDNTFLFGAVGDLHAGSKYCRWDVREDLYREAHRAGAQCMFDTGNWIDGEATFNRYDIEAHGLDQQCRLLAERHPKIKGLHTYAVWGDDHEGWYVQREGIDVGRYNESIMRSAGHEWTNLGFMESHVILRNANSGKAAVMTVVHPGGGSAYALSYSIQKIVESYEGGEKPNVGLFGHYHKIWAGVIRNVWCVQTGCAQDQTPFMRKKRLEAHVGGALVELRQDPESGAITRMKPDLLRYFNRGFYQGRWSKHEAAVLPKRSIAAIRG